MKNTNSRTHSFASTVIPGFAGRVSRSILTLALFVALSCGLAPATVRANAFKTLYVPGDTYVRYTSDHIPSPDGVLQDIGPSYIDNDGHIIDYYNNLLTYHTDGSISYTSNEVVGFVYQGAGGPGQTFP